ARAAAVSGGRDALTVPATYRNSYERQTERASGLFQLVQLVRHGLCGENRRSPCDTKRTLRPAHSYVDLWVIVLPYLGSCVLALASECAARLCVLHQSHG